MSFSINSGKELAAAPRPIILCDFTFGDGSVYSAATIAVTFGGRTYEASIDDQSIDQLAALSEQGISRIPSATIRIADPTGAKYATYERGAGKGFKGAQVQLTFALYDVASDTYSTDSFIPYLGICDQPAVDAQFISVSSQAKLNFTRFMLPTAPIQTTCVLINPATLAQRAEADTVGSPYYYCGETRDLSTAPPCSYTNQTCTRPHRRLNVSWEPSPTGTGREYISGNWSSWRNADTSGKYKEFWPLVLGGTSWLSCVAIQQFGDGNYTRGHAAVAFGAANVLRVIVNGSELSPPPSKDYEWDYVNNGARDGTLDTDSSFSGITDAYGNATVIRWRVPKSICAPDSLANIQVLVGATSSQSAITIATVSASNGPIHIHFGRPTVVTDPGDGYTVTITGCSFAPANGTWTVRYVTSDDWYLEGSLADGSGSGGTLYYHNKIQSGGAPTSNLIQSTLGWCGVSTDELDGSTFSTAQAICAGSISFTDSEGNSQSQSRYASAIALRERRSAADILRGLLQSINGALVPGQDGNIQLQVEGPLGEQQPAAVGEQQPAAVDGSNTTTGITSELRDGTSGTGYPAYRFDESNSWDLKRIAQPISSSPNRVTFPFSDPVRDYAISTFSLIESDDVGRIGQENPGGLQVQPEGIASYNHALRCARLGLAKIHRGNPVGDTRGTDWWQWTASFRGCKLRIGQIVTLNDTRYNLTDQQVRLTEIKPAKNYETVTFKGHFHNDDWYSDAHGNVADPGYTIVGRQQLGATVAPTFAVEQAIDPTVAEVAGLTFSDTANTYSISAGTWTFYYADPSTNLTALTANVTTGDTSISVSDASGISEGDYLQIGKEIVLCGAPSGTTVPVTRAQLASVARTATSGDQVFKVLIKVQTATFPLDFINSAAVNDWALLCPLPEMLLLSVGGSVSNPYGESPTSYVCLTDNADHGLFLHAIPAGTDSYQTHNVTNADWTVPAGRWQVNVTATTVDCTITLPSDVPPGGVPIIVKRAAGSTHDVIVKAAGTETIESSTTPITLGNTGQSVTVSGTGTGNWLIIASSGDITAPAAPPAPSLTSVTGTVNYVTVGGVQYWNVEGDIPLPDTTYLKAIHGWWREAAMDILLITDYSSAVSGVLHYVTSNQPRDTANHFIHLQFQSENQDGSRFAGTILTLTVTGGEGVNPNAPPAPDITDATVTITTSNRAGFNPIARPTGTCTMPVSDPDYSHVREVRVWLTIPDYAADQSAPVASVLYPFSLDGSNRIKWAAKAIERDDLAHAGTATFATVNENGQVTMSAISRSFTIPSSTGITAIAAPAVNSSWITHLDSFGSRVAGCGLSFEQWNTWKVKAVYGTITPPVGTDCTYLIAVRITVTKPGGQSFDFTVKGPFSAGSGVDFSVDIGDLLDPANGILTYGIAFAGLNQDGAASATYTTSVSATPPSITSASLTASETGPRVADAQRMVTTNFGVSVGITNNPGGIVQTTFWTTYDFGDYRSVVTTNEGWFPVTGSSGSFTFKNKIVTQLGSCTVTVSAYPNAISGNTIPAGASTTTFTLTGTGTALATWLTNISIAIQYVQGGWVPIVNCTAPFSSNTSLKAMKMTVQHVNGSGVADSAYGEQEFGSIQPGNAAYNSGTGVVSFRPANAWGFPVAGYTYTKFRLKLYADAPDGVWTAQTNYTGTPPTGVVYGASYADVTPDPNQGPVTVTFPPANNIVAATVGTVSYPTMRVHGSVPRWKMNGGTITLPSDYSHVSVIHISAGDAGEIATLFSPFSPDGGGNISWSSNVIPQPVTQQTYDLTFVVENETGEQTASPLVLPAALTVNGCGNTDGYHTLSADGSNNVAVDCTYYNNKYVVGTTPVTFIAPIYTGAPLNQGTRFCLYLIQTGSYPAPTFSTGAGGFAPSVQAQFNGFAALGVNVRAKATFVLHDDGLWDLDFPPMMS